MTTFWTWKTNCLSITILHVFRRVFADVQLKKVCVRGSRKKLFKVVPTTIIADEVLNASRMLSSGASTWAAVAAQHSIDTARHGPVSIFWHNSYHSEFETCSGWWFQPIWKIWKLVGMIIPNIWKNNNPVPNHQPDNLWICEKTKLYPSLHQNLTVTYDMMIWYPSWL